MSRLEVVTAIAIGGLVAALFTVPSQAAQQRARAASRAFDGLWSVYIRTAYGPCDADYRYPARIVRRRVLQADNDFSYQLAGLVAPSGAITVTVYRGGQSATVYGRLRGSNGAGRWSAGGNACYGTWSAARRGV